VDPDLPFVFFPKIFCKRLDKLFANAPPPSKTFNAFVWCCSCTNNLRSAPKPLPHKSGFPLGKCVAGVSAGPRAISPSPTLKDVAEKPLFPPLDRALVTATACETVAQTQQPLSRQSLADLTVRVNKVLVHPMSRSTVWRILHEDAIKPWQYEHWIFPRDPQFAHKAGFVLDLYAGFWEGQPLGPKDYVLSKDEKTSIQARKRSH
jgi:hypothetical protein